MKTKASSINRALDQIGDQWTLLILQELFWGVDTFTELVSMTGISKGVLADRLKWLQQIDCLGKTEQVGKRPRYHLTAKAVDLYPAAMMALAFERQFFKNSKLDEIDVIHQACGKPFQPRMHCRACGDEVHAMDIRYIDGPGSRIEERAIKVRRRSALPSQAKNNYRNMYKNVVHLVGDRWTANVIALAFHRIKRFDSFHQQLPVASNILTSRLKFLLEERVIEQVRYRQKPSRYEYQLTPLGFGLFPFFLALLQWGDRWCDETGEGPPMVLEHMTCGQPLEGIVACSECSSEVALGDVALDRSFLSRKNADISVERS